MSQDPINNSEIQRFEAQYRQNPDSLVFARLADAYRKAGNPARAIEILDTGIARHRNYPSAHIVRARTCIDLGQSGAAEESYLRVLELDGSNLVALRGLAALARERGDLAGARQWFQKISGLHLEPPESADIADTVPVIIPVIAPELSEDPPLPTNVEPLPKTEQEWWTPDSTRLVPTVESEEPEPAASGSPEAWWFEDPDEGEPADDGDLLTRTMAQLYEKQGLVEEAAAIYKELLSDRPGDQEILAALARLETRIAAVVPEMSSSDKLADEVPGLDDLLDDLLDGPIDEPLDDLLDEPDSLPIQVAEPVANQSTVYDSGKGDVLRNWLRRLGA